MRTFKIAASYDFLDTLVPQKSHFGLASNEFNNGPIFGVQKGIAGKCLGLLHIYKLTNNQLFLQLADQLYSNLLDHWAPSLQGWPNHALHIKNVDQHFEHIKQFRENNKIFFSSKKALDSSFGDGNSGIAYAINTYEELTGKIGSTERNIPILRLLPKEDIEITLNTSAETMQALRAFTIQHLTALWIKTLFPSILNLDKGQFLHRFHFAPDASVYWNYKNFYEQFETYIKRFVFPDLNTSTLEQFIKTLEYDHSKNQLQLDIENKALERARELYINTILPNFLSLENEELFNSIHCRLNQNFTLLESVETSPVILLYLTDGILDININTFEYIFLSNYEEAKTGFEALKAIEVEYGVDPNTKALKDKAINFLRKMIFLKVLVPCRSRGCSFTD